MCTYNGPRKCAVSVIVPSYNHARYLPSAIQSIREQTFGDWEAIIIDDGSLDDTSKVFGQFDDNRVHYVYQDNQGLSAARNKGLALAVGDFVAFLDADDEWEPDFLEASLQLLGSDQSLAGVYTRNYFIDQAGERLPRLGGEIVPPEKFRERILEGGIFPPSCATLRSAAVRRTGPFDTNFTSLQDWDYWIRISQSATLRGIDRPLASYRVHPGNMSTDNERMHADRLKVLKKHFGNDEEDLEEWPADKRRAYGFAIRDSAFEFLRRNRNEDAWRLLGQGANYWPGLLERLDTFYELACGDQPQGYRGEVAQLDINANGRDLLYRLDLLFDSAGPAVDFRRKHAHANAYLALAMLSDQAGRWDDALSYLLQAAKADPRLLLSYSVMRRAGKLMVGYRVIGIVRRLMIPGAPSNTPYDSPSPKV